MWVVRLLLERGYSVRGTVRDEGKVKYIEEYFSKRGFGGDKLELVIVPDIVKVRFYSYSYGFKSKYQP